MSKRKRPTREQFTALVTLMDRVPLNQLQIVLEVDFDTFRTKSSLRGSASHIRKNNGSIGGVKGIGSVKPSPDLLKLVEHYYPHVPTPLIAEKFPVSLDIIYTVAAEYGIDKRDTAVTCNGLSGSPFADNLSKQRYLELKGVVS